MKINILALAVIASGMAAVATQAKTLTPEEALARVGSSAGLHKIAGKNAPQSRLVYTEEAQGSPALYVFDKPAANDGYLILSADDMAYPVLGYADSGEFDSENMPEAMKWWLQQYADQIAYARANAGKIVMAPRKADADGRKPIEPMIKTAWDQIEPYNNQCPSYSGVRTYTGCVATSMAQVMNYWKYPERGKGTITYTASTIQKRLSMNFAAKAFDWANMLDRYEEGQYDDTQAAAVAYLMKACGYAVKMDYGTDSSGALAMNVANALTRYFDYDGNIDYQLRQYYSSTEWAEKMYANLRDVGPVIYGGGSMIGGGHSFICDGYSSDGYFHFNWGWTGMSNGYFKLEGLNPYALGSGGGSGGGYNFTQDAVFGIQPPTGKPVVEQPEVVTQCGSLAGTIEGSVLSFDLFAEAEAMWVNYNPNTLNIKFGVRIEPQGGTSGDIRYAEISDRTFDLAPGYGTGPSMFNPSLDLNSLDLADGIYTLTIVTADYKAETTVWQDIKVNYGYFKSLTLTRSGSNYDVTNQDVCRLVILDASVKPGKLSYGCTHQFTVKITNDNDIELTSGFAPVVFYNGTAVMLGESIFVSLKPGETVERTWDSALYLLDRNFNVTGDITVQLSFFDEGTYNIYSADVLKSYTMMANQGAPTLQTNTLRVMGQQLTQEQFEGTTVSVYRVADTADKIQVVAGIRLVKGYCAYPVYACLTSTEVDENGNVAIINSAGHPVYIDSSGKQDLFVTDLDITGAKDGKLYGILMAYEFSGSLYPIQGSVVYIRTVTSGVEDVATDEASLLKRQGNSLVASGNALIEVYNTSGMHVGTAEGEFDLTTLGSGLYIARANGVTLKLKL